MASLDYDTVWDFFHPVFLKQHVLFTSGFHSLFWRVFFWVALLNTPFVCLWIRPQSRQRPRVTRRPGLLASQLLVLAQAFFLTPLYSAAPVLLPVANLLTSF